MYKAAIIGDMNSIYGFAAIGVETFVADDPATALKSVKNIILGEAYAVIFITEKVYLEIHEELYNLTQGKMLPAIIPIPGVSGNAGIGINNLHKAVEQAVGSDIIFGEG